MTDNNLDDLRRALAGPPGDHLDDETLAELATAEAAGEPLEETFAAELAHVEACAACAEAYFELVEMMLAATGEMAAAARAVSPLQAYTTLLCESVDAPRKQVEPLALRLAALLPALFTAPPATPEQITDGQLAPGFPDNGDRRIMAALVAAVRGHLPALALYLERVAADFWRQVGRATLQASGRWQALRLTDSGTAVRETRPTYQAEDELPLAIAVWAERISPLACHLYVEVTQPDQTPAAGLAVEIAYGGQIRFGSTGADGLVHFAPLPIAALANLSLRIAI